MANKFIVTLKQGIFKPNGDQVLAVYGTLKRKGDSITIEEVLTLSVDDIYSIFEYEGTVNEEKIWVL